MNSAVQCICLLHTGLLCEWCTYLLKLLIGYIWSGYLLMLNLYWINTNELYENLVRLWKRQLTSQLFITAVHCCKLTNFEERCSFSLKICFVCFKVILTYAHTILHMSTIYVKYRVIPNDELFMFKMLPTNQCKNLVITTQDRFWYWLAKLHSYQLCLWSKSSLSCIIICF